MRWRLSTRCLLFLFAVMSAHSETWTDALANMPLGDRVTELTRSNCVPVMLQAFRPNAAIKVLIFMPGATDEFYFFRRASARLPDSTQTPSLLDAVSALTNQTFIRATFQPPFLLLHTSEDPLEPSFQIKHRDTFDRLQKKSFVKPFVWNDRDWDYVHPLLSFYLNMRIVPGKFSSHTTHFFRHSMAGANLTGLEALQAVSLANKTRFTIEKKRMVFEGDERFPSKPSVPTNWWALPHAP